MCNKGECTHTHTHTHTQSECQNWVDLQHNWVWSTSEVQSVDLQHTREQWQHTREQWQHTREQWQHTRAVTAQNVENQPTFFSLLNTTLVRLLKSDMTFNSPVIAQLKHLTFAVLAATHGSAVEVVLSFPFNPDWLSRCTKDNAIRHHHNRDTRLNCYHIYGYYVLFAWSRQAPFVCMSLPVYRNSLLV